MNSWRKIASFPEYVKGRVRKFKGKAKQQWESSGELKGIRTVDKRFLKK